MINIGASNLAIRPQPLSAAPSDAATLLGVGMLIISMTKQIENRHYMNRSAFRIQLQFLFAGKEVEKAEGVNLGSRVRYQMRLYALKDLLVRPKIDCVI
eukprot:754155-Hanusia_phi.AAC.2